MKRLFTKLLQGLTTAACAVAGATLAVSALDGELLWFGSGAAFRVGAPAFVAGLLFFPVGAKALASRAGFALRALVAATAACGVHRVLLWTQNDSIDLLPTLSGSGPFGLDTTMWLAVLAIGGAGLAAALAQPALLAIARAPAKKLLGGPATFDAQPARVGATRIRS